MRLHFLLVAVTSVFASGSALAITATPMADHPMNIDGVKTVCTGSSENAREDPRWQAYTTRVEFAAKNGEYLGDETVSVTGQGKDLSVHCSGPWLLMSLDKGAYKLGANIPGVGHESITVHAPSHVIVSFPVAGNHGRGKS